MPAGCVCVCVWVFATACLPALPVCVCHCVCMLVCVWCELIGVVAGSRWAVLWLKWLPSGRVGLSPSPCVALLIVNAVVGQHSPTAPPLPLLCSSPSLTSPPTTFLCVLEGCDFGHMIRKCFVFHYALKTKWPKRNPHTHTHTLPLPH